MKRLITLSLLSSLSLVAMPLSAKVELQWSGERAQLLVDGSPMLVLGGELSNSAATSVADIDSVMPRMASLGLNTVFVPAYWEFIEPAEGEYDFTLVDEAITTARANRLKVIFLWFGAWKNSMSCYAPLWFKQDTARFPRAQTDNGKPLEIASAFSTSVLEADNRAFGRLMRHIGEVDSDNTVIMMQVENEIGMLEAARDHSPLANEAWVGQVPEKLLKALSIDRQGTWEQVFGSDVYAEEKFQAYHYALYVERLCQTARSIHDIPLYVNAAMNSRGRKPGEYPSAGPLAHLIDIWRCGAPSIDIFAPDIYDTGFKQWVSQYRRADNPFFTPETRLGDYSGVRALYCFGEVDALGFSPFAIDQGSETSTWNVSQAYGLVGQLQPLLCSSRLAGRWGVLVDSEERERIIEDGETVITLAHYFTLPWDPRATDGSPWPEGGGMLLKLGENDYLLAGNGVVATFKTRSELEQEQNVVRGEDGFVERGSSDSPESVGKAFEGKRLGIGYVDQVEALPDGTLVRLRRDNGDQDHQGRHARISCGEYKILHVRLYEY